MAKNKIAKEILEWALTIIIPVVAALLIHQYLFTFARVDGISMLDTLHENNIMGVSRLHYRLNEPQRGEIITCNYPEDGNKLFVKRIIGLTGTPSSNGLMDLWAEFRLLDLGKRLGRFITEYRNNYFVPDKRNGQIIYSYKPQPYAEERIYGQISDITISMKSTDHLKMPELLSSEYEVHLSDDEVTRYEELKQELVLELPDGEITAANAASLTGKLSQLANGAIYSDTGDTIEFHDRKLDALEDIIESANGKPVLVAYWFKHDLSRIKKRFDVREIKSSKDITDWNAGKIPVAVIHPASAGHGLNLQAGGSTLIWFGLTWSLELYQQTNARLWRQGQTSGTVVIEHIITKGTIDERILNALSKKELTQNALIDAVKANL